MKLFNSSSFLISSAFNNNLYAKSPVKSGGSGLPSNISLHLELMPSAPTIKSAEHRLPSANTAAALVTSELGSTDAVYSISTTLALTSIVAPNSTARSSKH